MGARVRLIRGDIRLLLIAEFHLADLFQPFLTEGTLGSGTRRAMRAVALAE